jgi:DNA-binding transcriptional LysR family regulator
VRGESQAPTVYIRIGTINSVSSRILPSHIYNYWQSHPNVDIQVSEASTTDILGLLNDQKIDIGIIREPFNMRRYNHCQV